MKNSILLHDKIMRRGKALALMMLLLVHTLGVKAGTVDVRMARQVAKTFLDNNGARSTQLTDVSASAGFANVYVFTTANSFVLIAADDCVKPILGYSLTGRFDVENMPDNKRAWIQGYSDEIRFAIDNQLRASSEVTQQWHELMEGDPNSGRATTVVAPLIQTQWGQGSPYNMLCPSNSVTGCVATAMAQVMKYWNYPAHGIGWYSYIHPTYGEQFADFQSTTYDWNNMINSYSGSSTYAQKLAVATLMYHCGVSVDMNYSPGASGAVAAYVADALKTYFNYSTDAQYLVRLNYSDAVWINMLKSDLNQNRPIQYSGRSSGGGHSFVCDGYNSNNYFHFNWGWEGYCDEYYSIDNLNPGPGGIGSGSNGIYNDDQCAIFGVHPSDCTANAPSNLNYTQNGRNVTLSWSAASGASSYNIYRNTSYIGNVSSTSYTDVAPYGSSVYYVRSLDSNGRLSLSSNAVTVTVDYQVPVVDDLAATVSGNNVNLSWSAPEWCYPETPSATLTYGNGGYSGSVGYSGSNTMYWGHRYLSSALGAYDNMLIYEVSFYANSTGAYKLYVYKGTTSNHPQTQILEQSFSVGSTGWFNIELSNTIEIDDAQDLWVFIYDPEYRSYPATYCSYEGSDGNYYSTSPTSWVSTWDNAAFNIRTFVTDGTYTYNVYRNGSSIATNVTNTSYSDNALATGVYNYYVKTNYYGGETNASNQVTVQIGNSSSSQISTFAQGYNWWCSYIEQEDIDGLGILQEGLGDIGVSIRSQASGYTDYYENYGWYGSLTSINNESSYKVITNAPCTVTMTGNIAEPLEHPITVSQGWTWIGYVPSTAMDVNAAMEGMDASQGDKLKSQQGYADFYPSYGWFGSLNTIEPGMGLMYYSLNSNPVTFIYPESNKGGEMRANLTSENNHWVPNVHTYSDNMTVMAVVELNDEELNTENYELAVFAANGECRGSVKLTYAEPLNRLVAFLTISGKDAAELDFRLYNTETNEEYYDAEESLDFVANAIVGEADDLYVVHFRGTTGMDEFAGRVRVYPNPVNRAERFSIGLAGDMTNPVHVEIINTLGMVETLRTTSHQTLTAPNVAGVYTLRITVEGKGTIVRKLVVK